jgi:hypothetical protein
VPVEVEGLVVTSEPEVLVTVAHALFELAETPAELKARTR